jgi:insulysin
MAETYCSMFRKERVETFPYHSYFVDKFDKSAILELLLLLRPERSIITIMAKKPGMSFERREKWMSVDYSVLPFIQDPTMHSLAGSKAVEMPGPNIFIPKNVTLSKESYAVPMKIADYEGCKLFHFADNSFETPKASIQFNLKTPSIRPGDARSLCLAYLYNRFVDERLNEYSYDASVAGLQYGCQTKENTGILISVNGYNEKSLILWGKALETLKNPKLDISLFEIFKSGLKRTLRSASKNSVLILILSQPLQQCNERLSSLLLTPFSTALQLC